MNYLQKSKFLSLILRHKPEVINITLDQQGWANINEVIKGMKISMQDLEYIVNNDNKQRYTFNEDKSKIRANQGHSSNLHIDLDLKEQTPPDVLYHGTKQHFLDKIMAEGLKPMKRSYVHLTEDINTAQITADRRKGKSVILEIDAKAMINKQTFYLSKNNVWLTTHVNPKYIKRAH